MECTGYRAHGTCKMQCTGMQIPRGAAQPEARRSGSERAGVSAAALPSDSEVVARPLARGRSTPASPSGRSAAGAAAAQTSR
eukprot:scaffold23491_cov66-Phaeocystis_antarctica.AAC.12